MNKTNIEWADYTWNPVTGCLHGCPYCYARRFAERGLGEYGKHPKGLRFSPRFHPERLDEPAKVKTPSKIFVGSMTDMFGSWVGSKALTVVRDAAARAPQHTYIWLTKRPDQAAIWYWRKNNWVGATVTQQSELIWSLKMLSRLKSAGVRFISFEPLLGTIEVIPRIYADILDWIIIGPQTGPGAPPADFDSIGLLVKQAQALGIPVFCKDSCGWWARYREFPVGVRP